MKRIPVLYKGLQLMPMKASKARRLISRSLLVHTNKIEDKDITVSLQEPTKQVVTIDVGSKYEFIWSEDDIEEFTVTKIEGDKVYDDKGGYLLKETLQGLDEYKDDIASINGIPRDQIAEVRFDDEVMYEPVALETFVKMLEYNNYKYHMTTDAGRVIYKYDNRDVTLPSSDISNPWADTYSVSIGGCFRMSSDSWEDVINIIIPKLGLKPVPVFDFKQYLVDNGFNTESIHEGFDWFIAGKRRIIKVWGANGGYYTNQRIAIKPTKENADILIRMNNLAKEIEHA